MATDLTVAELKTILRLKKICATGNKNELILRLQESNPDGSWIEEWLEERRHDSDDEHQEKNYLQKDYDDMQLQMDMAQQTTMTLILQLQQQKIQYSPVSDPKTDSRVEPNFAATSSNFETPTISVRESGMPTLVVVSSPSSIPVQGGTSQSTNALVGILEAKRQKKQKRALRSSEATDSTKCEPPVELSSSSGNLFNGSPLTTSLNKSISNSSVFEKKKKHRENEKKRKLRKEDIGLPHNFRHVTHVGCNADSKHLELESIDPQLKEVFTTAGVSDNQLKNPKMRDFIYDFIDNHGGVQAFVKENALLNVKKSEVHDSKPPNALEPPPPVPPRTTSAVMFSSSNNGQTRTAPPLPPSKTLSPATPNAPPVHKVLPMRPPPPNTNSAAFFQPSQPPPPPPPPPSLKDATAAFSIPLPPPLPIFNDVETSTESSRKVENESSSTRNNISQGEDCRSMLMESIRSGTTLKKVTREEVKPKVQPDSRNDLLSQIRQGIELKPVSNEQKRSTVSVPQDGLIGALSRALAERSRAIHSDSDDSFSDSSEEDDWDD